MHLAEGEALSLADWLGVLATVIAVIGVVLSIYLYRRGKDSKFLQYTMLRAQSLETNAPFPGLAIDVSYASGNPHDEYGSARKAIPVRKPRIWTFRIKNAGSRELVGDTDFQEPLRVEAKSGKLVDVFVKQVSREGVHAIESLVSGQAEVASVSIAPKLMNRGDWMEILVLTDGAEDPPKITTWLRGETRRLQEVTQDQLELVKLRKQLMQAGALGVLGLLISFGGLAALKYDPWPSWISVVMMVGGIGVASLGQYILKRPLSAIVLLAIRGKLL